MESPGHSTWAFFVLLPLTAKLIRSQRVICGDRATFRHPPSFKLVLDMRNISVILGKVNKHEKAPVFRWGLFV
jgi:hypothetical protein